MSACTLMDNYAITPQYFWIINHFQTHFKESLTHRGIIGKTSVLPLCQKGISSEQKSDSVWLTAPGTISRAKGEKKCFESVNLWKYYWICSHKIAPCGYSPVACVGEGVPVDLWVTWRDQETIWIKTSLNNREPQKMTEAQVWQLAPWN